MKHALLSADGRYRYLLSRVIGPGPTATFIMLNPSTADDEVDDPTVRRCLGFCKRWGCGRLEIVNLFAVRTPSPAEMMKAADPIGPDNWQHVQRAICERGRSGQRLSRTGPLVCAWGVHGGFMGKDLELLGWLGHDPARRPMCLGVTREGHPRHPLYVGYKARLRPYARRKLPDRG